MHKQPISSERSVAAIGFIRWSLDSGKSQDEMLNYVPLPTALIEQIELYGQLVTQAAADRKRAKSHVRVGTMPVKFR
jgi:hypothetical protein